MGFLTLWNISCRALALDAIFPKIKLFGGYLMTFWHKYRNVDVINGCFWMVRREALDQVGLLDERFFIYAEDIDWCKRFIEAGWKVVYFPRAEALHYGGASSSNAPIRFYIEMQKANLKFWQKHYGRFSYSVYYTINVLHHSLRVLGYSIFRPRKNKDSSYKIKRSISSIKALLGVKKDW
jgi:GT2 family glycosyltransferase